jgi:hypothetical protein
MYNILLGEHAASIFRVIPYIPEQFVTTYYKRDAQEAGFPSRLISVLIQHFNFLQKLAVVIEVTGNT